MEQSRLGVPSEPVDKGCGAGAVAPAWRVSAGISQRPRSLQSVNVADRAFRRYRARAALRSAGRTRATGSDVPRVRGQPMTSRRSSSCVNTTCLAAPGLVAHGAWGRFAETPPRSHSKKTAFKDLVAAIRSGPPPGLLRVGGCVASRTSTSSSSTPRTCAGRTVYGPRVIPPAEDAALFRNAGRAPWFPSRRLRGAGLELVWAGTGKVVTARRGLPAVRVQRASRRAIAVPLRTGTRPTSRSPARPRPSRHSQRRRQPTPGCGPV